MSALSKRDVFFFFFNQVWLYFCIFIFAYFCCFFVGAQQDRSESEGLKLACTHFQISSWAFRSVCEKFNTDPTTDLSPELMQWLSLVCVAQAQECILEKSILDHRKPGTYILTYLYFGVKKYCIIHYKNIFQVSLLK